MQRPLSCCSGAAQNQTASANATANSFLGNISVTVHAADANCAVSRYVMALRLFQTLMLWRIVVLLQMRHVSVLLNIANALLLLTTSVAITAVADYEL